MALQRPDRPRNNLLQAARERLASPSRSGLPMSRQELADAVNAYLWDKYWQPENLSENDIGKLERGEIRWPGERRREAFRAVLRAETDAELGFHGSRRRRRTQAHSTIKDVEGEQGDAVIVKIMANGQVHTLQLSRRGLFEAVTGSLVAPLLNQSQVQELTTIDPAIVDHFAGLRAALVESDNRVGAAVVLPTVHHQLGVIVQFRRKARGPLHERLLRTEARWAEFAGWLSDDLGDHASGAWWMSQSTTMAQESNDPDFLAYVFARMAQRAAEGPDRDRVLSLAEAAGRVETSSMHVRAFAAVQRARGHAAAGEAYLFQSAIGEARAFIEEQTARDGDLGSFCTVPYVIAHEAEGWLRLKRPKTTARRFAEALAVWPDRFQRDKGLYLSRAAVALLASGQPEEAATTALEALKLADATRSTRIRREVAALAQQLTTFGDRPAITPLLAALAHTEATS